MKQYILIIFLVLPSLVIANNKKLDAKLTNVTVFLSGAQVTRTATLQIQPGTTNIILDGLSPNIEEHSVQVSGLKNTSILSINYGINFLNNQKDSEDIETLKTEVEMLKDKIQLEEHLIHGYNEEMYVIQHNRSLSNQNQVVNLEKLQAFAKYYRQRITEIKASVYESNKKKDAYCKELNALKNQLSEYNAKDKVQSGEIKLKLHSAATTQLNLIITYNVTQAGWVPMYDIKAKDVNSPLQLTYKAHVYQNTGQNWNDVKLTLSTSNPNTNNIKPEVNPMYLNFMTSNYRSSRAVKRKKYTYNPLIKSVSGVVLSATDGLPLPGVNVVEKGTSNGTQTDFDGKYTLQIRSGNTLVYSFISMMTEEIPIHASVMNVNLQEDALALDEVVVSGYASRSRDTSGYNNSVQHMIDIEFDDNTYAVQQNYTTHGDLIEDGITNRSFEIHKPYDISSNEDVTVIEIDNYEMPSTYSYFAAPLLNENVFLTAMVENFEHYNLLPAEANVYFEGSYSGKTYINPQTTSEDELIISLGVDPNVVVKRTQPKDFKKHTFIGNNKVIAKHYDVEVKNNKNSAIDLVLYDRIPISQHKEIKVSDIDTGSSEYDSKKGILKWTMNVASNAKETLNFSYSLKYPKYKQINLQ